MDSQDGHGAKNDGLARLTDRQRQVWEMTKGLGKWEGRPMKAPAIAEALGISANAVYVTRRRVKQILEGEGDDWRHPKRIIRQESRIEMAIEALEAELASSIDEEAALMARVEQLRRERPEVERVLNDLKSVATPGGPEHDGNDGNASKKVAEGVAAA